MERVVNVDDVQEGKYSDKESDDEEDDVELERERT